KDPAPTASTTLSLHDALPIYGRNKALPIRREKRILLSIPWRRGRDDQPLLAPRPGGGAFGSGLRSAGNRSNTAFIAVTALPCSRSEEHTSELQSRFDLVCRLL